MSDEVPMNALEAEYKHIAGMNGWTLLYQQIVRDSHATTYTVTEAKKVHNRHLNRYRDVNPYDHSRIMLERSDVDYINANLVELESADRRYILTQGPLALTVEHFWLMVWEQNSRAIVMLNKIVEKSEIKCHPYWPIPTRETKDLPEVGLKVVLLNTTENTDYFIRRFRIVDTITDESREIVQFHYTAWPDFGVPSSPIALLRFLQTVRDSGALAANVGPAIVHCSAGIGRSGTFCLVDASLVIIERDGPDNVNVPGVLLQLRRGRMGLIQTPDQLKFSYQAIIEGARRLDPNYVWRDEDDDLYAVVAEEDVPPPHPPRRVASLAGAGAGAQPPARPLPAIPTSASADNMSLQDNSSSSSDSNEEEELPPPLEAFETESDSDNDNGGNSISTVQAADDMVVRMRSQERKIKDEKMKEQIRAIKKKALEAERWEEWKRSLVKPVLIVSIILVGIMWAYSYRQR